MGVNFFIDIFFIAVTYIKKFWFEFFNSVVISFGFIFLFTESYEVLTDKNIVISFSQFLLAAIAPGSALFFLRGLVINGFLRRKIIIPNHINDTKINIKFGDIFLEDGWKVISCNDFFDSIVDEDLISSKSLHGIAINKFWVNNKEDWDKQVSSSLRDKASEKVARGKGKRLRYPIGTTARLSTKGNKFLFVALAKTNTLDNTNTSNSEMLIRAVRGVLVEARAACAMEPLSIPVMGSGLSRISIKKSVLIDLILTAIYEENKVSKITTEINLIVDVEDYSYINIKSYQDKWS